PAGGEVGRVDAGMIGQACLQLGAGRARASDGVDHAVGIDQLVKVGEEVRHGQPLCRIHARNSVDYDIAEAMIEKAIALRD
ncbi:MAG: hypothetical protein MUF04_14800, partial [Akkermansiaceae bacterium]|nr:hypothetical protein [Akkermansiaceae bacterium]